MRKLNLENVTAVEETQSAGYLIPINGYFCRITNIEDVEAKEYIKISYDIADGEFKNFYEKAVYPPYFIRSYKPAALGFFKGFIECVEKSNPDYKFNEENLNDIIGKFIGLVINQEEYVNKSGEVKVINTVDACRSCQAIKEGDFNLPKFKSITPKPEIVKNTQAVMVDVSSETDGEDFPW